MNNFRPVVFLGEAALVTTAVAIVHNLPFATTMTLDIPALAGAIVPLLALVWQLAVQKAELVSLINGLAKRLDDRCNKLNDAILERRTDHLLLEQRVARCETDTACNFRLAERVSAKHSGLQHTQQQQSTDD